MKDPEATQGFLKAVKLARQLEYACQPLTQGQDPREVAAAFLLLAAATDVQMRGSGSKLEDAQMFTDLATSLRRAVREIF